MNDIITPDEVFDLIWQRGGDKARFSFEGGNDEGCPSEPTILCGNTVIETLVKRPLWSRDPETGRLVERTDTWEDRLVDALYEPLYTRYGSFAFEGYCHGTVVWDANKRTVCIAGNESEEVWRSFSEEEQY